MIPSKYCHLVLLCGALALVLVMLLLLTLDNRYHGSVRIGQEHAQSYAFQGYPTQSYPSQSHPIQSNASICPSHPTTELRAQDGNRLEAIQQDLATMAQNVAIIDFDLNKPARAHYKPETCHARLLEYLCEEALPLINGQEQADFASRATTLSWTFDLAEHCSATTTRVALIALLSDASFKGSNSLNTFAATVRLLDDDHFKFYAHIDERSSTEFKNAVADLISRYSRRITLAKHSYAVNWGGSRMVVATIATMIQAQREFCPDFVINLSETHLAAMRAATMLKWLKQHKEINFLHQLRPVRKDEWEVKKNYFYISDCEDAMKPVRVHVSGKLPSEDGRSPLHDPHHVLTTVINSSWRLEQTRMVSGIPNLSPWKGSQWFVLSRGFVDWFLTSDVPRQILSFFEWWEIPDEKYFATCLAFSPYNATVNKKHPAHYVASRKNGRVAKISDVETAVRKKSLFVRKVINSTLIKEAEALIRATLTLESTPPI